MEDLIRRQAAIDECYQITIDGEIYKVVQVETLIGLPSIQSTADTCPYYCELIPGTEKQCIKSEQMKWIPVTERLPEKHGAYLVYDKEEVLMGYYSTFDRDWTGMNGFPLVNVIAWMPLPEPYKGEK